MPSLRFSIAGFMALVIFLAVGLAAFRSGAEYWFTGLYTAMVTVLLTAVVAARYSRRRAGAFWFGFAVFGWGFLLLGLGLPHPDAMSQAGQPHGMSVNPALATTTLLRQAYPRLVKIETLRQLAAFGNVLAIGHLVITGVVASLGGVLAVVLKERRSGWTPAPRPAPSPGQTRFRRILAGLLIIGVFLATGLAIVPVIRRSLAPKRSPASYVPPRLLEPTDPLYGAGPGSLGHVLAAMDEPSLWTRSQSDPKASAYRLTWLDDDEYPICIRVERTAAGIKARMVVLEKDGPTSYGPIAIDKTIAVSESQWDQLVSGLAEAKFWDMSSTEAGAGFGPYDHLVVEGVQSGYYHLVARSFPEPGPYLELCKTFLVLAGISDPVTLQRLNQGANASFRSVPPGERP